MSTVYRLGRRAQFRRGDLVVGIVRTSADPADPWARLNLVDDGALTGDVVQVRAGDVVPVGRHELTLVEVVPGSRDGYVTFTVRWPEGAPDEPAE
ncbi:MULTISPECIES: hypothetical protein [Streptomycetaceae]|uniref:hypothetical protein n=1 Tax=Streptomycetaceae TaxID=2062 RepID=UPI003008536F